VDKEIFNNIKTIYDTCMDEDTIKKQGKEPIINLLNKFDLYNSKSKYEGVDGLSILIANLQQYDVSPFFVNFISSDLIDPSINDFSISQPKLLLMTDQYKNEVLVSQYKTMITETLNKLFDDQKEDRNIEEMANKIIEFEIKLSEILISGYAILKIKYIKIFIQILFKF